MLHEPEPVRRVRAALAACGLDAEIRIFPTHLPTAPAAAAAVGVELGRIAKSILFLHDGRPVLVVASGDRRVSRPRVRDHLGGGKVALAGPDEVLAHTGFVAGGVAPVGLASPATVLLDEGLKRFDHIWAGGGVPEALVRLPVAELPRLTGGTWAAVCE